MPVLIAGTMIRTAIAALAFTLSTAAAAHSFWLQPVDHTPRQGEDLLVEFKVGDAGDVKDWGLYWERIASLRLFGPDGVTDQQLAVRTTAVGEAGSAVINVQAPGSYILAFESNPSFSDLEAERFNRYLDHEGLSAIAAHREAMGTSGESGTEIYMRRAKTLLQAGEQLTPNVTRTIGQILEIRPLSNPFALAQGDQLRLQVFWRGEPLEGAKLSAAALDATGAAETYMTSADGVVTLAAPGSAPMLYSVVWGVPAPNDTRADYLTVFASLTVAGAEAQSGAAN